MLLFLIVWNYFKAARTANFTCFVCNLMQVRDEEEEGEEMDDTTDGRGLIFEVIIFFLMETAILLSHCEYRCFGKFLVASLYLYNLIIYENTPTIHIPINLKQAKKKLYRFIFIYWFNLLVVHQKI
jgi:hypothetical protein